MGAALKTNLVRIPAVRIFEIGTHRSGTPKEKTYTREDADDIVRNFQEFQSGLNSIFRPPVVIGHEEEQSLTKNSEGSGLKNTGIPRFGSPSRLWHDGKFLWADIDEVPKSLGRLIKNGQYDSVSAEIYDQPPEGVKGGKGKMLRRIAVLGGDLPHIKSMADVLRVADFVEYSESRYRPHMLRTTRIEPRAEAGSYVVFSEVVPMDRTELIGSLKSKGFDQDVLQTLPDSGLTEIARFAECKEDDDDLDGMPEADGMEAMHKKIARYTEMAVKKYGEKFNEYRKKKSIPSMYSDEFKAAQNDLDSIRRETRRLQVETFCETLLKEGKVLSAELDRSHGGPNLADVLAVLPAAPVVHKFSENGQEKTVEVSFESACQVLKRRPVLMRFAERVASPSPNGAKDADDETAKVEEHYEQFSEQFKRLATTKDEMVGAFKAKRKLEPDLTAERFLTGPTPRK